MIAPLDALIPFIHVKDVGRSIAFYRKLGFTVRNTFVPPEQTEPTWAWLETGEARLMVARADAPVIAEQQAVLFYVYCEDVAYTRAALEKAGVATGPMLHPDHAPGGEFRIEDPDGYVLIVTHTGTPMEEGGKKEKVGSLAS